MENFEYLDVSKESIESGLEDELCAILYTEEYKDLMGLFLGLIKKKELTERALAVTTSVIEIVPAFYTAWNYRFEICILLYQLDVDKWNEELSWLDEFTLNNPKNYQIWSYRQAVLEHHPSPILTRELPILDLMIEDDAKNYHVWSYRKWCIKFFNDWSHELEFVNKYLVRDVYNNSAWSHRAFFMNGVETANTLIDIEIEYAKEKIRHVPQNVSPWNYLNFLYKKFKNNVYDDSIVQFALQFVDEILETEKASYQVKSSFALEFLVDVYSTVDPQKSKKALKALSETFDPIRKNYWQYRISRLSQ